jgi:hypothetical protein
MTHNSLTLLYTHTALFGFFFFCCCNFYFFFLFYFGTQSTLGSVALGAAVAASNLVDNALSGVGGGTVTTTTNTGQQQQPSFDLPDLVDPNANKDAESKPPPRRKQLFGNAAAASKKQSPTTTTTTQLPYLERQIQELQNKVLQPRPQDVITIDDNNNNNNNKNGGGAGGTRPVNEEELRLLQQEEQALQEKADMQEAAKMQQQQQQVEEEQQRRLEEEQERLQKQQQEEEEARRLRAEQEEEARKAAAEAEAKRQEAQRQEELLKQQQREEEARIQAQQAELARLQKLEEEGQAPAKAAAAATAQVSPQKRQGLQEQQAVLTTFQKWQQQQAAKQLQLQQQQQEQSPPNGVNAGNSAVQAISKFVKGALGGDAASEPPIPPPMKNIEGPGGIWKDLFGTGDEAIIKAGALTAAATAAAAAAGNAIRIFNEKGQQSKTQTQKSTSDQKDTNMFRRDEQRSVGGSSSSNSGGGSSFTQKQIDSTKSQSQQAQTPPSSPRPTVATDISNSPAPKTPPSSISFGQSTSSSSFSSVKPSQVTASFPPDPKNSASPFDDKPPSTFSSDSQPKVSQPSSSSSSTIPPPPPPSWNQEPPVKKSFSPFGGTKPQQPQSTKQPFSPFATNGSFAGPAANDESRTAADAPPKQSFSPFGSPPNASGSASPAKPSTSSSSSSSPFGGGPKPFARPNEPLQETVAEKQSFSPFGIPKQPAEKQSFSPFGGGDTKPKETPSNPFSSNGDNSSSSSTDRPAKQTLSPFGTSSPNNVPANPFTSSVRPKVPSSPATPSQDGDASRPQSPFSGAPKPVDVANGNQDNKPDTSRPPSPFSGPPKAFGVTNEGVYRPPASSSDSSFGRGSSPSQDDVYANLRKEQETTRSSGGSPAESMKQDEKPADATPKKSFSPFGQKPTAAAPPPQPKPEPVKTSATTSSFGVSSGTSFQSTAGSSTVPKSGQSPFGNTPFSPATPNFGGQSPFGSPKEPEQVKPSAPSLFGVSSDTQIPPKTESPSKTSFSPFGLSPKSPPAKKDEIKPPPKPNESQPTTPAFGVARDTKFNQPNSSQSTLSTPITGLRPPLKRKEEPKKREADRSGNFNLSEVNERVDDEYSNLSRDEQIAAEEERRRIQELQKARDRVMNILSGGMGGESKEESKPKAETQPTPPSPTSEQRSDIDSGSSAETSAVKADASSPFIAPPAKDTNTPTPVDPARSSASSSTDAPPKKTFSPFGGKKNESAATPNFSSTPWGSSSSSSTEAPKQSTESTKESFSPFGSKPKQAASPSSGASVPQTMGIPPLKSDSPFDRADRPITNGTPPNSNAGDTMTTANGAGQTKKSFSPFGGAPKRPASTNPSDSLYAPPSSPFESSRRNEPMTPAQTTPSQPFQTNQEAPKVEQRQIPSPPIEENVVQAELLSKDEPEPNGKPMEQPFFSSNTVSTQPRSPPQPQDVMSTNRDTPPGISFATRPRNIQPGSLSSTVNMGVLPAETPAKPNRPFAASTFPRGQPISSDRSRLMDLESTRRVAMDQMEGSLVEKLQPRVRVPRTAVPQQQQQERVANSPPPPQQQQLQQPSGESTTTTTTREKILNAILAADDNYVPSDFAMQASMPGALLQEVEGASLVNYDCAEAVYAGTSVHVQGGSSLSVPVKVTVPGSVVSYTIERKSSSSDCFFGISSQIGLDQVETVKVRKNHRNVVFCCCGGVLMFMMMKR